MSEYQYYEFLAVDRPLDREAREALRAISSRARITATSFTNSYNFGDFKGDPRKFMARWFDVHVYVANWGSRRLMIRLPARLVPRRLLDAVLVKDGPAIANVAGTNLILDICRDEEARDDWDDGTSWLAALLPLREAAIAGDLRLLYLVWLMGLEAEMIRADRHEPLPGLGPLSAAHEAFAEFFGMDMDLVQAAAERRVEPPSGPDSALIRERIAALPDRERIDLLTRLAEGGPDVAAEIKAALRSPVQHADAAPIAGSRTAGELLERAREIRAARERAEAAAAAAKRQRAAEAAVKARRARLDELAQRGDKVWDVVEAEIEQRNQQGYDRAAELLADLRALAEERGDTAAFLDRLRVIRDRHARKGQLMKRLVSLG